LLFFAFRFLARRLPLQLFEPSQTTWFAFLSSAGAESWSVGLRWRSSKRGGWCRPMQKM